MDIFRNNNNMLNVDDDILLDGTNLNYTRLLNFNTFKAYKASTIFISDSRCKKQQQLLVTLAKQRIIIKALYEKLHQNINENC